MSGALTSAKLYRIKAAHRRRRRSASGRFVQRYYDPTISRFLSVDPVTAHSGTGANFNRYWYANNNPYRFTDPDGRQSVGETIDNGAQGCSAVSCAGWAALRATWDVFGAEGVSQISDKGMNASAGNKVMAAVEVGTVGYGGKVGAAVKATLGVVERVAGSLSKNLASGLGDLTRGEAKAIQGVVNQAGRPLDVVGSAASGTRRGVGTDLPIGKGPGTRSDIDYTTAASNVGNFNGLQQKLSGLAPHGILKGTPEKELPSIRFEPKP